MTQCEYSTGNASMLAKQNAALDYCEVKHVRRLRDISLLPTRLFLTRASAARSIVGECNREDAIRNHRERFGNWRYLALLLCVALLLASLAANSLERAEAGCCAISRAESAGREAATDQLILCSRQRASREIYLRRCGHFSCARLDRAARRHTELRAGGG